MRLKTGGISLNWIDGSQVQREQDIVLSWARKMSVPAVGTGGKQKSTLSLWQDENVREYGWSNLSELRKQLNANWGQSPEMQEIALACAVAAYKLRHRNETSKKLGNQSEHEKHKQSQVPDYIYAF